MCCCCSHTARVFGLGITLLFAGKRKPRPHTALELATVIFAMCWPGSEIKDETSTLASYGVQNSSLLTAVVSHSSSKGGAVLSHSQ